MGEYVLFGVLFVAAIIAISRGVMRTKEQELIRTYTVKYNMLREREIQLNKSEDINKLRKKKLDDQESSLAKARQAFVLRERTLDQEIDNQATIRLRNMLSNVSNRGYFSGTAVFDEIRVNAPIEANRRLLTAQMPTSVLQC